MASVSKLPGVVVIFPPAQLRFQDSRPLPVERRISLRRRKHSSVLAVPSDTPAITFAVSLNRLSISALLVTTRPACRRNLRPAAFQGFKLEFAFQFVDRAHD